MTYYLVSLSFKVVGQNDYDALLKADQALKSYGLMYIIQAQDSMPPSLRSTLSVKAAVDDEGKPI